MNIMYYDNKCDNCGKSNPGTFVQVWRHISKIEGVKQQYWCFDCFHGRNFLPEIKRAITFIFLKENGKYIPNGTGFLVSVEAEKDPSAYVGYLVTARHVLQNHKKEFYPMVSVRINTHDNKSKYLDIDLNKTEIFTHNDIDVDIAVISISLNKEMFDYKLIPENIIPNQEITEKLQISEGDEVFFAGLFENHYGQQKNMPILRFGRVALISDEKIEYKEDKGASPKFLDLYLLECEAYRGNSGSPVFFNLLREQGRKLDEQGSNIYLAGIMMGNFNEIEILSYDTYSNQNLGIAAITPSYKLHEILYSKRVKENRNSATEYFTHLR